MKNVLVIFAFTFFAGPLFAQNMWAPENLSQFSELEQQLISRLGAIDQKNKTFVELFFDIGVYQDCGIGTVLSHDKIYVSIVNNTTEMKYSYIVDLQKSLVNENPIYFTSGKLLHLLVFDQTTIDLEGKLQKEIVFMHFLFGLDKKLESLNVYTNSNVPYGFICHIKK